MSSQLGKTYVAVSDSECQIDFYTVSPIDLHTDRIQFDYRVDPAKSDRDFMRIICFDKNHVTSVLMLGEQVQDFIRTIHEQICDKSIPHGRE
jgi:galactose-1-phosphate uridylyltransferase